MKIINNILLAKKVASDWLVESGIFKAPPNLLEDVLDFCVSKYAGHIWAKTNERIERIREDRVDYGRMYDEVKKTYKNNARFKEDMIGEDSVHFTLRPDKNKGIEIWREEELGNDRYEYYYQYTENERKKGREFGPYKSYEIGDKFYNAFNSALQELHQKDRKNENMMEDSDTSLVDLVRLKKIVRKYADKPRAYKTTARTTIPVDISGWEYTKGADLTEAYEKLEDFDLDKIKVILHFKGHVTRGGQWHPGKKELQVDMPLDAFTPDKFEANIESIRQTAEHECQHVGQSAMKIIKDLDDIGGIPSESITDEDYDSKGFSDRGRQRSHPLRDNEFYTRLKNEIDEFENKLSEIPKEYRRAALRVWVADSTDSDEEKLDEINDELGLDDKIRSPKRFFFMLKRNEPEKWEKAVKELVGELNDRGFDLG